MTDSNSVPIQILDKFYRFKCSHPEQQELQLAAQFLDQKMRDIRDNGKIIGVERVAVMAALNIAHELMALQNQKSSYIDTMGNRINILQKKIEEALSQNEQMEL